MKGEEDWFPALPRQIGLRHGRRDVPIAHALNVRGIVEGNVRQDGKRVRIAAELVDAGGKN